MALPCQPAVLRVRQHVYRRYLLTKCAVQMAVPTGGVGVINGTGTTEDNTGTLGITTQLLVRCTAAGGKLVQKLVPVSRAGAYAFGFTGVPAGAWTVEARVTEGFAGPNRIAGAAVTVT